MLVTLRHRWPLPKGERRRRRGVPELPPDAALPSLVFPRGKSLYRLRLQHHLRAQRTFLDLVHEEALIDEHAAFFRTETAFLTPSRGRWRFFPNPHGMVLFGVRDPGQVESWSRRLWAEAAGETRREPLVSRLQADALAEGERTAEALSRYAVKGDGISPDRSRIEVEPGEWRMLKTVPKPSDLAAVLDDRSLSELIEFRDGHRSTLNGSVRRGQ